jgi:hypothetical protein
VFPVTILACEVVARSWRLPGARITVGVLAGILLLEEINTLPTAALEVPLHSAFFDKVGRVPSACRVFFAENARPGPDVEGLYRHNVDAMLIAELTGVPTVNGMATFTPPDWSLNQPQNPDYLLRVRQWLASHDIRQGVCGLDAQAGEWRLRLP